MKYAANRVKPNSPDPECPLFFRLLGPILIAAVSAVVLWWTWGSWPDVFFDMGRELYVPWQLTEGKTLYRDIAYFNGPLSPYLNSIFFHLFGVSLRTLFCCNIVLAGLLLAALYRILREIGDRFSATVACLAFATIFGFGNLHALGNANFICPYSHEATHGVILGAFALLFLLKYCLKSRLIFIAGAGLAMGLSFLTKAEVFLATFCAVCAGIALILWTERKERAPLGQALKLLAIFAGTALLPVLLALVLLCTAMPFKEAFRGTIGTWAWLPNSQITSMSFYTFGMGLKPLAMHLNKLASWTGIYALIFFLAALPPLILSRGIKKRWGPALLCFALVVAGLGFFRESVSWLDAARPLPLLMLLLGGCAFYAFVRNRSTASLRRLAIPRVCMILFAALLLGKMILNVRLYHYGFVLAMPATLLTVVAVLCWVPGWLDRLGGRGRLFQGIALGILVIFMASHLQMVDKWLKMKTVEIGSHGDAYLGDRRGHAIKDLLTEVSRQVGEEETLAVFPEGVVINYLSRRANSTPYSIFLPVEVILFGEDSMIQALDEQPPDFIALIHRSTRLYDALYFGQHYAMGLYAWIAQHYQAVRLFGNQPFTDKGFGILLLKKK